MCIRDSFIIALIKFRFEPSPVSIKETCEESEWGAKITRVSETHLSQEAKPTSDTSSKDIFQSALNRYIVEYTMSCNNTACCSHVLVCVLYHR